MSYGNLIKEHGLLPEMRDIWKNYYRRKHIVSLVL